MGDSRTILVNKKEQYQLSEDADPENSRFERRVKKMDYSVEHRLNDVPRVFSSEHAYALTRDIDVPELFPKPKITCATYGKEGYDEKARTVNFQEGNYLVLACDGLWDILSNKDVGEGIRDMEDLGPQRMASRLVEAAYEYGSSDNISAMVVKLQKPE